MGKAKTPKAPPAPSPIATEVIAEKSAGAMKKRLKQRQGAGSTWLTRGQSLGTNETL